MYRPQYLDKQEVKTYPYSESYTRIHSPAGSKQKLNHEVVPFRGRRKPKNAKVGHRGGNLWL